MMDLDKVCIIAIFACMVSSCKEKLIDPPENLIPQADMTELLYDLALINGLRSTNPDLLKQHNIETMPYLYKKYNVDSLQFAKSDEYYASVPTIYQAMYNTVQQRLENQISEIDEQRKRKTDSVRTKNQKTRDSLKNKATSSSPPVHVPSEK